MSLKTFFGSLVPRLHTPAYGVDNYQNKNKHNILNTDDELCKRHRIQLCLETGYDIDIICFHRTGSSYVCNPPILDTDVDYIILVSSITGACAELGKNGFRHCSQYPNLNGKFLAMRKGELNFIITVDHIYYLRYVAATELSKIMNLKEKEDRINLFHAILDEDHYYRSRKLPIL